MRKSDANFKDLLGRINKCLIEHLEAYPYGISEMTQLAAYVVESRGHRWRPILFLKTYLTLSLQRDVQSVLPVACAIEFLHTASIILDDLPSMDNALLRRGKKASHLVFGEAEAILAAMWLCDVAQYLIHKMGLGEEERWFHLEDDFRKLKSRLIMGQLVDLQQKANKIPQIIQMYELKSGVFYAFTASVPAYLLGMHQMIKPLERFGNYLGIAYQLGDDIADQVATEKELGKEIHKDDGKSTVPRLFGVKRAVELRDLYRDKAIGELQKLPLPTDELVNLADRIIRG